MAVERSHVLDFDAEGFSTIIIKESENELSFRLNVKTVEEFRCWKNLYTLQNNTCLNLKRTRNQVTSEYHGEYQCLHGDIRHKGVKKTYTG